MDIKGLDLTEISLRLEMYVANYFTDFTLPAGQCLFAESYLFYFDEVKHMIPDKYHHLFKDTDKFNGASGFIKVDGQEYVLMLLVDEDYSKALFLLVQEPDNDSDAQRNILIADFMK